MVDIMEYSKNGSIEVIVGPMYAGKSEELIRRINRARIAELEVIAFKPRIDNRYCKDTITSHNGKHADCITVDTSQDIREYIKDKEFDVLAIDEVQFFDEGLVEFCQWTADNGKRIICSGLDMDFRAEPFQIVPQLMSIAEHVSKLTAVCMVCKLPATRTQRLVNGKPAKYSDPIILVGAKEDYEARCRKCHTVIKD
ncbi:thymidine kinase [Alkaliphilus pronyensis]|uniref:Thymidine kinase n=1 Tax=Alkaliphilus pronyensis TaxID=1482732 RepID=A0A6I0FB28_9FIRM|nr:thymidine kinase [Alkaliphilus pronyensis]KAB3534690.1 thymidine kinase [Alkaliphilus pronyensis]